jgi:hypothetical protein
MSLSVVTDLPSTTPVRDPAWYEVQCNGYRITAPVAAVFTIGLLQQPVEDDTFTLAFLGAVVTFTFVTGEPDDSGTQVRIGVDAPATLANLLVALQANWYVDQHFQFEQGEVEHTATARVARVLEVGLTNTSPPAIAFNQSAVGVDAVFAPNYSAVHQIWIETSWGSGIYTPLPARDGRPDADRRTRWDLHGMLRPYLGYEWPDFNQQPWTVLRKLRRRFYVTRYEQFGEPPVPKVVQRSATKIAWYAGSRNAENRDLQDVFSLVANTTIATPFLTYRGRMGRHEVSPAQQSYISWYRNVAKVADSQLKMVATVYYTDNSNSSVNIHLDTNGSGWELGDVAQFPTGFERMALDELEPTKTPTHYTVRILSAANVQLSEAYTYHLRQTDANELHLEWVNSLGVVETTRCIGQWVRGVRTEHELVDTLVPAVAGQLPGPQTSERDHHLLGMDQTIQFSTGFMDRRELEAHMDMLTSPRLFLVDHERSTRIRLIPQPGEYIMGQRGTADENLYALNLEGLVAHAEMAWSMRNAMPPVPDPEPEPPDDDDEDE